MQGVLGHYFSTVAAFLQDCMAGKPAGWTNVLWLNWNCDNQGDASK